MTTPSRKKRTGAPTRADTRSYERSQGATGENTEKRNPRTPHERDESARATGNRLDERPAPSDSQISQAQKDAESGQVDTDRRGIPNDIPTNRSK